jgi:hypothetical protein
MARKKVYAAISAVTADLAERGIAKTRLNENEGYRFRGIDDLYNALSPLLAKHRLCLLPRTLERQATRQAGQGGDTLVLIVVRVAFDFVSADDSSVHTIEVWGEAIDGSDKGTNKAVSAAFKYAAFQIFCIPLEPSADADLSTLTATPQARGVPLTPVQGWEQWAQDLTDLVRGCETHEALQRVQKTYGRDLRSLSADRTDLYASLGQVVQARRIELATRPAPSQPETTNETGQALNQEKADLPLTSAPILASALSETVHASTASAS